MVLYLSITSSYIYPRLLFIYLPITCSFQEEKMRFAKMQNHRSAFEDGILQVRRSDYELASKRYEAGRRQLIRERVEEARERREQHFAEEERARRVSFFFSFKNFRFVCDY